MAAATKTLPLASAFAPMSARRLLVFGGIALVAGGMLFGDIFAVFTLHQNAGQQGAALVDASQAVSRGDAQQVREVFTHLGGLLEDRGTKVDAHVHMSGAGYLALLLALVQPYVALAQATKKMLACLFIAGGVLLPVGIFTIHYVGLAYSPFAAIGWASVVADSAGALLLAVLITEAWGFRKYLRDRELAEPALPDDRNWSSRTLLGGGAFLILLGFLHGAGYAAFYLYQHERLETEILARMINSASATNLSAASAEVNNFGGLAGERAINIAVHSHIIEFGILAMLLAYVQPYVFLSETWKRRWTVLLLAGSVMLPVFVFLELKFGVIAGGIADVGGLLVIVALCGMLAGVLRYTGRLDAGGHL